MALVYQNGRPYYYRNKRVDGKVVRQYIACGQMAELLANQDAYKREQQQAQRAAREAERSAFAAARAPLLELIIDVELLVQAALLDAGYHRQNRGPWHRRKQ